MRLKRAAAHWWPMGAVVALALAGSVLALNATGRLGPVLQWIFVASARPEAGVFVNTITAVGTFTAAFAALYIATKDRKERQRERSAADRARANLVIIEIDGSEVRDIEAPAFKISVVNHSGAAVLNVRVVDLIINGRPSRQYFRPSDAYLPYVALKHGASIFRLEPETEEMEFAMRGTAVPTSDDIFDHPENHEPTITNDTRISASVQFTDAGGNVWRKSSTGRLIGPISDIS